MRECSHNHRPRRGVTKPFEVGKKPAMVALLEAKEAMFSRDLETQNETGSNRKRARELER